jgi:hypothetical protein
MRYIEQNDCECWKEVVVTYFKVLSQHFIAGSEESPQAG